MQNTPKTIEDQTLSQQKKEELKKKFGEFLRENNAGKPLKDGNMIDAYGESSFIEDFWLSQFDNLLKEKIERIKKERLTIPKSPLDITPREQMQQSVQPIYREYKSNEESHNQALDLAINILEE